MTFNLKLILLFRYPTTRKTLSWEARPSKTWLAWLGPSYALEELKMLYTWFSPYKLSLHIDIETGITHVEIHTLQSNIAAQSEWIHAINCFEYIDKYD
jgi:hypothetical protein